jgi:hypothetical protein
MACVFAQQFELHPDVLICCGESNAQCAAIALYAVFKIQQATCESIRRVIQKQGVEGFELDRSRLRFLWRQLICPDADNLRFRRAVVGGEDLDGMLRADLNRGQVIAGEFSLSAGRDGLRFQVRLGARSCPYFSYRHDYGLL